MHEFSKKIISSFLLVLILYPFSVVANANEMGYTFIHWSSDTTLDVSMDDGLAFKELSAAEVTQSITAGDALAALMLSVALSVDSYQESDNAEMFQFLSADVNGDGIVSSSDALALLRRAAKVDSFEPEWRFEEIHQDSDSAAYAGYVLGDVDGSWTSFLGYSAGNGSQETDNLIINELDEFSPTITSSNSVSVNVSGVSGGVIYAATSNDSQSMLERGAISQQFVGNEDGTLTVRLFVDSSVVQNYPNGLEAVNFTLGYSSEDQGSLTVESVDFPSNPLAAIPNDQGDAISLAMFFTVPKFAAVLATSDNEVNLYNVSGDTPIAEVAFSVGNDSVVNQFTVFDAALTEHNGGTSLPGGQSVFEYQMTDTESSVVYSLSNASDEDLEIDSATGIVVLNSELDNESVYEYSFTVVATDSEGNSSSQDVNVNVNVVRNFLDIDENGNVDALTDGLTLLKYAFGFRNNDMFGDSIATDSTLTYPQIESKIYHNSLVFDVDGDGFLGALSDGLLILRYLFGLRDDALTNGVVSEYAERNSYDEIINYLDALKN
ncbi:cadherin repeat domain-containing protein [Porticoccaceae bacterium]|nr:cadherin repeat domain-containing protein [Porticoccaceae bacterium]